jgi:hypothetical protein
MRKTSVAAPLFTATGAAIPKPAPKGLQYEVVDVTPALAEKWLKQNTHNRTIRERVVLAYARDMEAGHWAENGEAIKFSEDGTLLDGQHRLNAITLAGVTVRMLVITGLANATQETMDAGAKRRTADAFGLRGETNASVLSSVTKRVWMWDQGDYKFNGPVPTTAEAAALLDQRPDLRRSADIAARTHQTFKCLPQSVTGTAHHLFTRIDGNATVWFFQRLADGAELPSGHPILTLRTRAMTEAAERRGTRADRQMAYLIRTWNAVREGRSLSRILQDPDASMPMPK